MIVAETSSVQEKKPFLCIKNGKYIRILNITKQDINNIFLKLKKRWHENHSNHLTIAEHPDRPDWFHISIVKSHFLNPEKVKKMIFEVREVLTVIISEIYENKKSRVAEVE